MSSLVLTLFGGMLSVACSLFLRFLLNARDAMVRAQAADDRERAARATVLLAEAKVGLVEAERDEAKKRRDEIEKTLKAATEAFTQQVLESGAERDDVLKQRDAFRRLLDECSGEIVCDGCKSTLATAARAGKDHFRATCRECLEREQIKVTVKNCERCGGLHGGLMSCGNSVAIGYNAYGYNTGRIIGYNAYGYNTGTIKETF